MKHRIITAGFAALLFLTAGVFAEKPIDPNDPPQGRFIDDWLEIYMGGGKVGYGHTAMTRDGDRIHTQTDMVLKIGRVDMRVTIEMKQYTIERVDGTPISFGSDLNAAQMKTSTRGEIADGKVTITTSQFGMKQKQTVDFVPGALMSWGMFRESLVRGFEPGTKYTVRTYAPEMRMDGPVDAHTVVGKWESFEYAGHKGEGHRVTVSMKAPIGAMELVSWVDKHGNALLAKLPAPGIGDMMLVTSDEKSALGDYVPPELFMTTTIPAKQRIDFKKAERISYRLRPKKGVGDKAALADMPQTDSQKVIENKDGSVDVIVSRLPRKPGSETTPVDRDALAEYLEANLMINIDDPELVKLAKKAAGGATDPYELADNLRKFVTDYVTTKSLNVGFATASEVCRTREGDCTEHGVFLAALGRLNGLPSRVAAGLAYVPLFGKQDDIFGYHMWTQFWIDGKWVDYDAALRESDCSPIRITFAVSSLKSSGLADLSLPLLNRIGAIDIDILEIEPIK